MIVSKRLSWPRSSREANRLRCELIDKKYLAGGLTEEQERRLGCLTAMYGAWTKYKFPIDFTIIERLEEAVSRIVAEREAENQFCLLSCD